MKLKSMFRVVLSLSAAFSLHAFAQDVSFSSLPVLQPNNQPGSSYVQNDINGDGISDLLWFNPGTNQLSYWLMSVDSNGNVTQTGTNTVTLPAGYFVGATGDFNGDGRTDLILTSSNHDLYLWTMTDTGFQSSYLGSYPSGLKLIGAGDVDGDGQPDLLWWNPQTNQVSYWLMQNGSQVGTNTLQVPAGYAVAAIGYFSQSNRISLILANSSTGDLYDWDSQGSSFTSYHIGTYKVFAGGNQYKLDGITMRNGLLFIETISPALYEDYSWFRQFDASGNQTSATFTNGRFGGVFLNQHLSGFVYCPQFPNASPLFAYTDTTGAGGIQNVPGEVFIPGPYQPLNISSTDSFKSVYPYGWYVIGAISNQFLQ